MSTDLPSYTSTRKTVHSRSSAEADMKIQLSSIKSDIKEVCTNDNATLITFFGKIVIFDLKMLINIYLQLLF